MKIKIKNLEIDICETEQVSSDCNEKSFIPDLRVESKSFLRRGLSRG